MSIQPETARTPEDLTRLVVERVRAKDATGVSAYALPNGAADT